MSTKQRNDAVMIGVDPSTADVLREQAVVTLEANSYFFEEVQAFGPEARSRWHSATAMRSRSSTRSGGGDRMSRPAWVEVPMTPGFTEQMLRRRYDLGHTNIDRFPVRDAEPDPVVQAEIDAAIAADREAAMTLDRLIAIAIAAY